MIVRDDVSFVVGERLLKKTIDQQSKIRAHLEPFAKFYGSMNERIDGYVRMFPVHPDYIGTFEKLVFTEKRGALVTLRDQIAGMLDDEVPEDRPGTIGYDSFWETVKSNSVLRTDTNIRPVLKVSDVLFERVSKAFTRPQYKDMALRIINGLSVHRLTTGGDIHVPVGPIAEELRDTLCLFHPGITEMGGEPDADLLSLVQTVMREILKTVNGQFISKAAETEQYFLDLKKDVDYDAQIEKRGETLSEESLDRAYFNAVARLMEQADELSYVVGHKIWQYRIEWQDRRVQRTGYIFLGAPNDRPTAHPERDFYIYFIQPFDPPKFRDENKADEVFFRLKGLDDAFRRLLSFYAAALELASVGSGDAKSVYLDKVGNALSEMSKWLRESQHEAFEVSHQGKSNTLRDWTKGISLRDKARLGSDELVNFRNVVDAVAGIALNNHFSDIAPDYPVFSSLVSESNRRQLIGSALRAFAGGALTKDAKVILEALEMMDGEQIAPSRSRYAQDVLALLQAKGDGKVLNRGELLVGEADAEYFDKERFRLEPDLLAVVLGGLVYSGDIVLAIAGDKIDAGKIALLSEKSLDELVQFKHVEAPKEMNVAMLRSLFEILDLPPGFAQKAAQGSDEPVKVLHEKVKDLTTRAIHAAAGMANGIIFWGKPLLDEPRGGGGGETQKKKKKYKKFKNIFRESGTLQYHWQIEEPADLARGGRGAEREFACSGFRREFARILPRE